MSACPDTPSNPPWRIACDGSAQPNPGRMGLGAVLTAPDGQVHTLSRQSPGYGCNNEAELRAVMAALHLAYQQGAREVCLYSDNSVLVSQMRNPQEPPIARLSALFDEARGLLQHFVHVEWIWVPRHRNREADVLARAALGLPPKPSPRIKGRRA